VRTYLIYSLQQTDSLLLLLCRLQARTNVTIFISSFSFFLFKKILSGNTNTYTIVENNLEPVIKATKIRLIPHSLHRRTGD